MKTKLRNERILFVASNFLLFSIILMVILIPIMLNNDSSNINSKGSAIGVSLALLIHTGIYLLFVKFKRDSRRSDKNRKGEYIGIGIMPILFGLIYMDGAIAFVNSNETLLESILMFISVFCDFVSGLMLITLYFLRPQKKV